MSLEHNAPALKPHEDAAFEHLFSDVRVVYPEDEGYRWDQRKGVIDGEAVYFVPSFMPTQSGDTLSPRRIIRRQRRDVVEREGLGIFPSREQLRMTRERAILGASAVAAVCTGVGAAYMTNSIPYVETPNYASDVPEKAATPDEKPTRVKRTEQVRPESVYLDYQPVTVYENYSASPRPDISPEVTPSLSAEDESPKPTPVQSEKEDTPLPTPKPSQTESEKPPTPVTPSPTPSPSATESASATPEVSPSPSVEENSPRNTESSTPKE